MIFNIAWRNVWRHPVRSAVVIVAIALGLWSGIFMISFSWGLTESRTRDIIATQTSHIQLHTNEFEAGEEMYHFLPEGHLTAQSLAQQPEVALVATRILASGMLESTKGNFGVQVRGVDPAAEAALTGLDDRVIAGSYLSEESHQTVLIGEVLARKIGALQVAEPDSAGASQLQLQPRRKVVVRFQSPEGEITAARFNIAGIYETQNSQLEESQIFVKASDLQALVGMEQGVQEIALLLHDVTQSDDVVLTLAEQFPDLKVETFRQLAPELEFVSSSLNATLRIFMGIILLALAFGIINTMLMAVLERTRELGMLMSIGMNKPRIFSMIMLESVLLTLVGAPIGLMAGWGTTEFFGKAGIDLSQFEQGLDEFGMSSMVYPELPADNYLEIVIMVIITALISAIFPAIRALKLNPSEAVRAL